MFSNIEDFTQKIITNPAQRASAAAFGCSIQGSRHKREGEISQDAYQILNLSIAGIPLLFAGVSDGHGARISPMRSRGNVSICGKVGVPLVRESGCP